jgi:hypothetical protein
VHSILARGLQTDGLLSSRSAPMLAAMLLFACDTSEFADPSREFADPIQAESPHNVEIHQPPGLGSVDTHLTDVNGAPIGVRCETCHGPQGDDSAWAQDEGNPEEVHDAVELAHGQLSCDACHDQDRSLLHLADGTTFPMAQAKDLCAQCHGVQHRDWSNGSHGGMSGYWDLDQGPRLRNHCIDCHAPHAPAWSPVSPVLPPMDRGLLQAKEHE